MLNKVKNENLFLMGKIMLKTLSIIGDEMNRNEITRGIGEFLLLYFHNLIDHPNEIDIIVAEDE